MAGVKRASRAIAGDAATAVASRPELTQSGFFCRPPRPADGTARPGERRRSLHPEPRGASPPRSPLPLSQSPPPAAPGGTDTLLAFCRHHQLSPKETRLLLLAIAGHNNDEIAELLACARPTVATHWNRIFAKTAQRGQRDVMAALVRWLVGGRQETPHSPIRSQ